MMFEFTNSPVKPAKAGYILLAEKKQDKKKDKKKVDKDSLKAAEARADSLQRIAEYYAQFSDTTIIDLDEVILAGDETYMQSFDKAVEIFDEGHFAEALSMFEVYSETLPPSDSLYHETLFFISECYVSMDNLNKAKALLEELEIFPGVDDAVMEKVYVRLGQIWCVLDDELRAEAYFQMLREKYPNSVYIPLANCSVVK
jgi:TolA-binding protein